MSVLRINQINSQDNGLTVRTPFQILVNYTFNKIINSNKQIGFKSNPMRTASILYIVAHLLVSYTVVNSECYVYKDLVWDPQVQLLIEVNSTDSEKT
jgi:hypothetical protein